MVNWAIVRKTWGDSRWAIGGAVLGTLVFVLIFVAGMTNMGTELLKFIGQFPFLKKIFEMGLGIQVGSEVSLTVLFAVSFTHLVPLALAWGTVVAIVTRTTVGEIEARHRRSVADAAGFALGSWCQHNRRLGTGRDVVRGGAVGGGHSRRSHLCQPRDATGGALRLGQRQPIGVASGRGGLGDAGGELVRPAGDRDCDCGGARLGVGHAAVCRALSAGLRANSPHGFVKLFSARRYRADGRVAHELAGRIGSHCPVRLGCRNGPLVPKGRPDGLMVFADDVDGALMFAG